MQVDYCLENIVELWVPEQIALGDTSKALIGDVEETARRVGEFRPLPGPVVKRIEDEHVELTRRINATTKWLENTENGCRFHDEFIFNYKWHKSEKQMLRRVGAAMIEFGKKLRNL